MYLLKYADGVITFPEALNVSITGIVVVMLILALLAVLVLLLSKAIRAVEGAAKKKAPKEEAVEAVPTATGVALPDSQSAGKLDLVNVDDKTAAVIMAIVSNESGIPLNRLQFNSIKKIEE